VHYTVLSLGEGM